MIKVKQKSSFGAFTVIIISFLMAKTVAYPPRTASSGPRTVMVTGANGYLANYIVKDLLASGHKVHACVRDAAKEESVQHLQALPGNERLRLFSTGNLLEVAETHAFDAAMKDCDAVFHAATPIEVKFGDHKDSGEKGIFQPAVVSTRELLDCLERHASTVQCLVLTSSMAAVAPRPEPAVKVESHWSDPEAQKQRENWYGCTKTTQELMTRDRIQKLKDSGKISNHFVYAAICPTMVIGPRLQAVSDPSQVPGTMGSLQRWLKGARSVAPNDSMSFIYVEDCAKMHTRILEMEASEINEHQRYMSLVESMHWNDILALFKELYPKLPEYTSYEGEDKAKPTQFNLDNMNSLGVSPKPTKETLKESIEYLVKIGALD